MDSSSDKDFEVAAFALGLVQISQRSCLHTQNGRFGSRIPLVFESSMASSISYGKKCASRRNVAFNCFPIAASASH